MFSHIFINTSHKSLCFGPGQACRQSKTKTGKTSRRRMLILGFADCLWHNELVLCGIADRGKD